LNLVKTNGCSGVQRSGDARGHCLIGCFLPNYSIEQWYVVVIVTGYQWCTRSGFGSPNRPDIRIVLDLDWLGYRFPPDTERPDYPN